MTSTWSMRNSTTQHGIDDLVIRRPETMVEPVEETFVGANTTNHTTWPGDGWGVVCKVKKFLYLLHDNWSSLRCSPSGDDSKITNFAVSLINISSICFRMSTYCLAKTVKSEFVLHSIADRETAGLKLSVQSKILWVNVIFVCRCNPFPRGGFLPVSYYSSGWPRNQNSLNSRTTSPGWDKMTT